MAGQLDEKTPLKGTTKDPSNIFSRLKMTFTGDDSYRHTSHQFGLKTPDGTPRGVRPASATDAEAATLAPVGVGALGPVDRPAALPLSEDVEAQKSSGDEESNANPAPGEEPDVLPHDLSPILKRTRWRVFVQFFTIGAVALEPLFSGFLWMSADEAPAAFMKVTFDADISPLVKWLFRVGVTPLVIFNLLCDLGVVGPGEEALSVSLPSEPDTRPLSNKILSWTNLGIALPSFAVLAGADVLPVSAFIKSAPDLVRIILNSTFSTGIVVLGVVYYLMFSGADISEHSDAFLSLTRKPKAFLKKLKENPLFILEAIWQGLIANPGYRGITGAYIMGTLLTALFDISSDKAISVALASIIGILTAENAMFARFLARYNALINEKYNKITYADIFRKISFSNLVKNFGLAYVTRGWPISMLLLFELPFSLPVNGAIGFGVSSLFMAHSLWVRYVNEARIDFLKKHPDLEYKKPLEATTQQDSSKLSSEDKLILQKHKQACALFEQAKEKHKFSSAYASYTTETINYGARFIRIIAFYTFVLFVLNTLLKFNFHPLSVLALAVLWGSGVLESDGAVFGQKLRNNLQRVATLWEIDTIQKNLEDKCLGERSVVRKIVDSATKPFRVGFWDTHVDNSGPALRIAAGIGTVGEYELPVRQLTPVPQVTVLENDEGAASDVERRRVSLNSSSSDLFGRIDDPNPSTSRKGSLG